MQKNYISHDLEFSLHITTEISKCILEKKRAHRFQNGKTYQFKKYDGSKRNIKPLIKPLHGKKEILKMGVQRDKLQKSLGGIYEMKKVPDLVFVIDLSLIHI